MVAVGREHVVDAVLSDGDGTITLVLCGDINVQARADPTSVFQRVRSELATADILFGDLEMCLHKPTSRIPNKPEWIQSDERMVEGLVDAGFNVVSCANNVTYGADPILSTLAVLDRHGISHTGSGSNIAEAHAPAIVDRGGVRVGFLAYTSVFSPFDHAAGPDTPGVSTIKCHTAYEPHPRVYELPGAPAITRSWPDKEALAQMQHHIADVRSRVDVLVTYFHWGVSGVEELAEYQPIVAHHAVDAGADLVIGSHAHVPQGIEVYKNKVIFYGLGNFAFDWPKMRNHRTGLIATCSLAESGIVRVSFQPVWRNLDELNQPEILTIKDDTGRRIVGRVEQLSAVLGTTLIPDGDGMLVWGSRTS